MADDLFSQFASAFPQLNPEELQKYMTKPAGQAPSPFDALKLPSSMLSGDQLADIASSLPNLSKPEFPPAFTDLMNMGTLSRLKPGEVLDEKIPFEVWMTKASIDIKKTLETAYIYTPDWTDDHFRSGLPMWCDTIGCDPLHLLVVLATESRLRPGTCAPFGARVEEAVAVGLNQVTRVALQDLGWLPWSPPDPDNKSSAKHKLHEENNSKAKVGYKELAKKFVAMDVAQQFTQVVIPYFANVKKKYNVDSWNSAEKLYLANLAAGSLYLANDPKNVIYPAGSEGYSGNTQFDVNPHDGKITVSDIAGVVASNRNLSQFTAAKFRFGWLTGQIYRNEMGYVVKNPSF